MSSQSTDELREDVLGLIENVAGWASGMNTNGNPETVADDIMQLITSYTDKKVREAHMQGWHEGRAAANIAELTKSKDKEDK